MTTTGARDGPAAAAPVRPDDACTACLRRGELIGRLAPRIAGLLQRRSRRPHGLLGVSDEELIAALAGTDGDRERRWLDGFDDRRARSALEAAALEAVCHHSDRYPDGPRRLPDPPAILYVAGGLARLSALVGEPAVTVVGGRDATTHALEVAVALGRGLAAAGITVVSGLALGIDGAAHRGALEGGDSLIAVLAGGADVPYPRSHAGLYRRVRSRGAVVSELPPGTEPMRWSFPARNRIMAALGRVTVVVEAGERSGSLITAGFAGDLGRGVCAMPGRVTSGRAGGSNRLLREGAIVVRGAEDVLDELFGVGGVARGGGDEAEGELEEASRRRALAARSAAVAPADLAASARRVLDAVEAGHGPEAIGQRAGLPPGEVRAALGRLELLGLVARDGLGLYERTPSA